MRDGSYPTPAQTSIFVDDIWIDDAYQVNYEEENARIPIYGYNRSDFGMVADGKVIITGNIVINFRYPDYLGRAIRNALRFRSNQKERAQRNQNLQDPYAPSPLAKPRLDRAQMRRLLQDIRTASPTDRIKKMGEALAKGTFGQVAGLSRSLFGQSESERIIGSLLDDANPVRMSSREGGFNIQLVYGHASGRSVVEKIEECYITGRSKVLTAAAGSGGNSSGNVVYEVYPFIAKRVQSDIVDLSQRAQDPTEE